MLKSIIALLLAMLSVQWAAAQDNTNRKQPQRKITGQDSASWHQRKVPRADTPPVHVQPYRQNTVAPLPGRPTTVDMQPRGVNPDSMRMPGSKMPGAPIQGPVDPMRK